MSKVQLIVKTELKELIKNSNERVTDYKNLLEEVYKDKITFPLDNDLVNWYKSFLRENKNLEQNLLKQLVKEKTFENEGLNPPFYYPEYSFNIKS
jgi:hypothetical protein